MFTSDSILKVRIEAPFDDLIRTAPGSTGRYDGTLTVTDAFTERFPIHLSARGISRRNPGACDFPPLRIELAEQPGDASLLRGQRSLKLATHCRKSADFQNFNLLEYASYRLFSVLTPISFRVRLADIDYVERHTGSVRIHRLGFFIEDIDEVAARNSLREVKVEKIERSQLNAAAVARTDLFQYMIGNQDWSDRLPTVDRNCCHNVRLLGASADAARDLTPVPYDFDSSGLVDAPYALPPVGMPIRTVRERNYRGLCQFNVQAIEAAHALADKRADMLAALEATPHLAARNKSSARRYLEDFFEQIADPARFRREVLEKCRN